MEWRSREQPVDHLGLLETQDVGSFLQQELLDDGEPCADRIDVPGSDLHPSGHDPDVAMGDRAVDVALRRRRWAQT
jgi:hypothetical protein